MSVFTRTCGRCGERLAYDDAPGLWFDAEGSQVCGDDVHEPAPLMSKKTAREVVRRRTSGYYVDGLRGLFQDCPLCPKGAPVRRVHTTRPHGLATDVKAYQAVVAAMVEHLVDVHEQQEALS